MKAINRHSNRRSRPFTVALLVAAAGWYVYAWAFSDRQQQPAYWRAENGRLAPAKPAATVASPTLLKPSPADLLARAAELSLSRQQVGRLQSIERAWSERRGQLEGSIRRSTAFLSANKSRSLDQLQGNLDGYAILSREYGRARQEAWNSALNVLTQDQRDAALAALNGGQK